MLGRGVGYGIGDRIGDGTKIGQAADSRSKVQGSHSCRNGGWRGSVTYLRSSIAAYVGQCLVGTPRFPQNYILRRFPQGTIGSEFLPLGSCDWFPSLKGSL